ncbi:MAG TPA: hypothetical protein VGJ60_16635 [Chloroflexota bacterium]
MTTLDDLRHVLFDGQPAVICHVCPRHKAMADRLNCDDERNADGECAHVQYRACDCTDPDLCAACEVLG